VQQPCENSLCTTHIKSIAGGERRRQETSAVQPQTKLRTHSDKKMIKQSNGNPHNENEEKQI